MAENKIHQNLDKPKKKNHYQLVRAFSLVRKNSQIKTENR